MLREAFRVLKPGGRFAVSDVVVRGEAPPEVRRNMELWIGCVAGALEEMEYRDLLADAGFRRVDVEPTRIYKAEDAAAFLTGSGLDPATFAAQIDGKFMSAFVRATKPARARRANTAAADRKSACCGPDCCYTDGERHDDINRTRRCRDDSTRDRRAISRESIALLDGERLADGRRRRSDCAVSVVAERDGAIVGVVGIELLRRVRAASLDCRRAMRGAAAASGGSSSNAAIAEAEARGVDALYLLTTTAETYFPSFGFASIDARRRPEPRSARRTNSGRVSGVRDGDVACRSPRRDEPIMRYALISDIHANLPALDAVLADIATQATLTRRIISAISSAMRRGRTKSSRGSRASASPASPATTTRPSRRTTSTAAAGTRIARQEELSHLSYAWTREHVTADTKRVLGDAAVSHRPSPARRSHRRADADAACTAIRR